MHSASVSPILKPSPSANATSPVPDRAASCVHSYPSHNVVVVVVVAVVEDCVTVVTVDVLVVTVDVVVVAEHMFWFRK